MGLFKKLVVSSYLILYLTDDVFAVPENHSSLIIFLAILGYSLVIYADFSGYSDMAIGFAGLMGFKSPLNFNFPYLTSNIRDFWRRWHITLSNWARDYIYIPLGGNRKGLSRKYLNLMSVMLLIGLWHGAAWHFIIWGGLHGLALIIYHSYRDFKKEIRIWPKFKFKGLFGKLLTFSFVSFAWIFFRAENTTNALRLIKGLFNFGNVVEPFKLYILFLVLLGFLIVMFEKQIIEGFTKLQARLPFVLWLFVGIFAILLIFKLAPDIVPPFIYFKF